jgi:hypothetical protein
MVSAENICRFVGKLIQYDLRVVGEGQYIMGSGKLLLPEGDSKDVGQIINIIAWGEIAERLEEIVSGSWVEMLTVYTPNEFKGKLRDLFTIDCFRIINE